MYIAVEVKISLPGERVAVGYCLRRGGELYTTGPEPVAIDLKTLFGAEPLGVEIENLSDEEVSREKGVELLAAARAAGAFASLCPRADTPEILMDKVLWRSANLQ